MRLLAATLIAMAMMIAVPAGAAEDNPFIATWKLVPAKSQFTNGPGLRSETVTFAMNGDMVVETSAIVDGEGRTLGGTNASKYDGKDYSVPERGMTVATKRLDHFTTERTWRAPGRPDQVYTCVVARDGKTMTVTLKGVGPNGAPYQNVMVFERV